MGLLADYLPSLPTDPNQNDAARQGLLAFGAAMLGGRGNFGQILGGGLAAGAGGYNSALQALQQKALIDAQTKHINMENDAAQAKIDEPGQIAAIIGGGASPSAPAMPSASAALVAGQPAPLSSLPQMSVDQNAAPLSMIPQASVPQASPALASASAQPAQPATQANRADLSAQYFAIGDKLTAAGKVGAAKQYYDLAQKMKPEVQEVKTAIDPATGKPAQVITFKDGSQKVSSFGALPDNQVVNLGGKTVLIDKNTGTSGASFDNTVSPDSKYSRGTQLAVEDARAARAKDDEQAPLSADAILNAAARYNVDGTLPPMGMGKNAAAGRSAILNKAAELKYGVDPEQQRRDQLANKGEVASQSAAVKAFTSGKHGNSVRSFNVALSHLDTLEQLSDNLNNTSSPAFNKLANVFKSQTGQAAPTSFEAVKHIVGDEIVKAVTGSAGALGDREAAAKTIASANSPAQLKAVVANYKELMRGQLNGLRQQYETSTGRTDFDRFLSDEAKKSAHGSAPKTNVKDVKDLPKSSSVPADISGLLNKYGTR